MLSLTAYKCRRRLWIFDWVIRLVAGVYFYVVHAIFWGYNVLTTRQIVSEPSSPNTLIFLSATELMEKIRWRKVKVAEIIKSYVDRIAEVNPLINAVVYENFDKALAEAIEIDNLIKSKSDSDLEELLRQKPLLGLPFTVKDTVKVKDQPCTAGIVALKEYCANETAPILQRLLDAGAILIARTNVPPMAMWLESANQVFGRTRNPYDHRRTPGGSSGGESALLGAGASLFGVGTDIAGSIRAPSMMCGIFGLLPSPGLLPVNGKIPSPDPDSYKSKVMSRFGPMTRFAEDLPLLMNIMSGSTIKIPPNLYNIKVYYMKGMEYCSITESPIIQQTNALKKVLTYLEECTGSRAERLKLPETKFATPIWFASFKERPEDIVLGQALNGPDGFDKPPINGPLEIIKYFLNQSNHSLGAILQAYGDYQVPFSAEERNQYIKIREHLKEKLIGILGTNSILVMPGMPRTADYHNELLFKQTVWGYLGFWNCLGFPSMQCPTGLSQYGLPTGVQIIASPGNDGLLISAAIKISEGFGGWTPPWQHVATWSLLQ